MAERFQIHREKRAAEGGFRDGGRGGGRGFGGGGRSFGGGGRSFGGRGGGRRRRDEDDGIRLCTGIP